MSSKIKKIISLVLAVLMIFVMMTACSSGDTSGDTQTQDTQDTQDTTQDTADDTGDTSDAATSDDPNDPLNADIDWRQFEGTELRVVMTTHWFQAAIEEMLPEFEELTGIKVSMENYAESEFWNKLLVEFNSNSGIDAYMMNYTNEAVYHTGGWIEDLNPYIDNPELTDAEWYDLDDFFASALDFGVYEDYRYGIPVTGEWQILFYRSDLYEKHGLEVPETMDELYDNAKFIQDNEDGVSGIVLRGARGSALWWPWSGFLRTYGGMWITDGVCTLDTPEAAAATEMYVKLLNDCGPAGVASYTYYEALTDFQQGKSAHFVDSSGFMGNVEDAESSAVAGKVGYAMMPGAAEGQAAVPNVNHWMMSIGKQSANKEAAWLLIEWMTCKQTHKAVAIANGSAARTSTWEDPDYTSLYPEDWAKVSLDSAAVADKNCIPCLAESAELGEYVEIAVTSLYEGGNASDVLATVTADSNALLQ